MIDPIAWRVAALLGLGILGYTLLWLREVYIIRRLRRMGLELDLARKQREVGSPMGQERKPTQGAGGWAG